MPDAAAPTFEDLREDAHALLVALHTAAMDVLIAVGKDRATDCWISTTNAVAARYSLVAVVRAMADAYPSDAPAAGQTDLTALMHALGVVPKVLGAESKDTPNAERAPSGTEGAR